MSEIEVREKRLTPEEVDYLQAWIDERLRQDTREALEGDGCPLFRGLLWALPLGLLMWVAIAAGAWWLM
jgi:hypothetical protein